MTANELFKAGRLSEAIEAQTKEVKKDAGDQAKRLFLFELLAFAGDLDRSRKQIDAVVYHQVELDTAVANYRRLLDAEQSRRRLQSEGLSPQFLMDEPEHCKQRLLALNCLREKRAAEAKELLDRANAESPPLKGQVNGKPFTCLRDCDDLFANLLEVMAQGNYYWVPLEQLSCLAMNPPGSPRDLLWVPAHLALRDGQEGDVFLPALYPGSHEHSDTQVKLGRSTDWKGSEEGPVLGVGLHTFLVEDDPVSLLEWRELVFS